VTFFLATAMKHERAETAERADKANQWVSALSAVSFFIALAEAENPS
jgi:hypothetical protein